MKTYSSKPGVGEKSREVPCLLCGSTRYSRKWDCGEFRFVKCRECGLVYQNPQTLSSHILSRYDDEYFAYERQNEEPFLNLMKLGLKDVGFYDWEESLKVRGKALDVGCATGALINWLSARDWVAEGLEICKPSADYAREKRGLTIHSEPLEKAGLEKESYSFIHSSHVIEHLNNPRAMVNEVYRLLTPGGYFACITPNITALQPFLYGNRWRSAIADHLVLFSARRLADLLEEEGFSIESRKTWGGLAAGSVPAWLKNSADGLAKRFGFGDVVILLGKK